MRENGGLKNHFCDSFQRNEIFISNKTRNTYLKPHQKKKKKKYRTNLIYYLTSPIYKGYTKQALGCSFFCNLNANLPPLKSKRAGYISTTITKHRVSAPKTGSHFNFLAKLELPDSHLSIGVYEIAYWPLKYTCTYIQQCELIATSIVNSFISLAV